MHVSAVTELLLHDPAQERMHAVELASFLRALLNALRFSGPE